MKVLRSSFKMRLQIAGVDHPIFEYPIYGFETSLTLSNIPVAKVDLAIGRDSRHLQPSPVHTELGKIRYMDKAQVFFRATGAKNSVEDWSDEEIVIFEGYFTGINTPKEVSSLTVSVTLVHWLAALTFSSVLVPKLTGGDPSWYAASAIHSRTESGGDSVGLFSSLESLLDLKQKLFDDIWLGIKDFLVWAGNQLSAVELLDGFQTFPGADAINTGGISALEKIVVPDEASTKISFAFTDPKSIGGAIADSVTRMGVETFMSWNYWDILVRQLLPSTMLTLVPRLSELDGAWIVPDPVGQRAIFRPAYKADTDPTISLDEYFSAVIDQHLKRPKRGLMLVGQHLSYTNYDQTISGEPARKPMQVHGYYEPGTEETKNGSIDCVAAPQWISFMFQYAGFDAGLPDQRATPGVSGAPDDEEDGSDAEQKAGLESEATSAIRRFAKSLYTQKALQGRSLTFSGPLRFDISPGSTVSIEGRPNKFIGQADKLQETMVGTVMSVSMRIQSYPKPGAYTAFSVGYARTLEENENREGFSLESHPLYETSKWAGGALTSENV